MLIMINEWEQPGGGGSSQWNKPTRRSKRRPRHKVGAEPLGGGVWPAKDGHVDALLHLKNRGLTLYGVRKSLFQLRQQYGTLINCFHWIKDVSACHPTENEYGENAIFFSLSVYRTKFSYYNLQAAIESIFYWSFLFKQILICKKNIVDNGRIILFWLYKTNNPLCTLWKAVYTTVEPLQRN